MTDDSHEHPDPSRVQSNDGGRRPRTSATGSQEPRNGDAPEVLFKVTEAASTPDADAKRGEAKAVLVRCLVRLFVDRKAASGKCAVPPEAERKVA